MQTRWNLTTVLAARFLVFGISAGALAGRRSAAADRASTFRSRPRPTSSPMGAASSGRRGTNDDRIDLQLSFRTILGIGHVFGEHGEHDGSAPKRARLQLASKGRDHEQTQLVPS